MIKKLFPTLFLLIISYSVYPQNSFEGFWLPQFLKDYNCKELERFGLEIPCDSLYGATAHSLFNGIVQFNRNLGTGAMVSEDGLILTGYHTAYSYIVQNSTEECNLIQSGFWAKSKEEELRCSGLSARFFIRMEDVTALILNSIPKNTSADMYAVWIQNRINELTKIYSSDGRYVVEIKSFYKGVNYYMFIYEEFNDIRLAGVPPVSIGKFGGETDNWVWPRHAGNFSLLRIYADPSGKPKEYDPSNVPLHSEYYYTISLKGIDKDNLTMVLGFPISTNRFMTSYEISNLLTKTNPAFLDACDALLPTIQNAIYGSENIRLKYSDWFSGLANNWKQKKGESYSLQKFNAMQRREARENRVRNWIARDSARIAEFINIFEDIEKVCTELDPIYEQYFWFSNLSLLSSKMLILPLQLKGIKPEKGEYFSAKKKDILMQNYRKLMANIDVATELKTIQASYRLWQKISPAQRPSLDAYITKYFNGNAAAFQDAIVKQSIFSNEKMFRKYLKHASVSRFERDPLVRYYYLNMEYLAKGEVKLKAYSEALEPLQQKYLYALRELRYENDRSMYPDANGTPRLSYGKVSDYSPSDGVNYSYYTTSEGIIQKNIPGHPEFSIAEKLKTLLNNQDFGKYGIDTQLPVCFITNNDISGGNSGSPVLNAKGELIGCVFDGNWEALTNNIIYNTDKQRAIAVDIRYVLFIIDKFAEATNIMKEVKIGE
ncbi:MAG: S46 family peptidase [Bacteroidetes bacterium]|nr:S46 family peptidase [Bacteroidota bacterium]MCL1969505.1 S46 family peptidase [Bacteroidota bacterium]